MKKFTDEEMGALLPTALDAAASVTMPSHSTANVTVASRSRKGRKG